MQPEELKSKQEMPEKGTGKTSITKTAIPRITPNPTYELLANELIDHFEERESRRQNNTKRKLSEKQEAEWWSEEGKRLRKARASERDRKRKQRLWWRQDD